MILESTDDQPKAKSASLTRSERIALDALGEALRKSGVERDGIVSVDEVAWRKEAISIGVSDAETDDGKRRAFNRAKHALIVAGKCSQHDQRYWLPLARPDKTRQDKQDI